MCAETNASQDNANMSQIIITETEENITKKISTLAIATGEIITEEIVHESIKETESKGDMILTNFKYLPQELLDHLWDHFLHNPRCLPEAHFFSASGTRVDCQIAKYYADTDDPDEPVDVYVPYSTHLQPSSSGWRASTDSTLWSVHSSKSAYLADYKLWNTCDESRARLAWLWERAHGTCAYDGLVNLRFPAANDTGLNTYITMRPGRDLMCIESLDDFERLYDVWANDLGGPYRARNIGFQLPPYWKLDRVTDSIHVDRHWLYKEINEYCRSNLRLLLYFLEGLESFKISDEPWRDTVDEDEEWDSIFIIDPLIKPMGDFNVELALQEKDRKVFCTGDGYLVEVKLSECAWCSPKKAKKASWTRPEHFNPYVTSCGFEIRNECIEPYLMESLARRDVKRIWEYPEQYQYMNNPQDYVDKHYRIPNIHVLAHVTMSSSSSSRTSLKRLDEAYSPDMKLYAEQLWAEMGIPFPEEAWTSMGRPLPADIGTFRNDLGRYLRKLEEGIFEEETDESLM